MKKIYEKISLLDIIEDFMVGMPRNLAGAFIKIINRRSVIRTNTI